MKKILILSFSPIKSDPRVMRQILASYKKYSLTVVGFGLKPDGNIEFFDVSSPASNFLSKLVKIILLLLKKYELYWLQNTSVKKSLEILKGRSFDLIISNDINTLPLAIKIGKKTPVFFDAHEYSPKEFEDNFLWKMLFSGLNDYLCRSYLHRASKLTSVCESISSEYKRVYGVKPHVILNAPDYKNLKPSKIDAQNIRIIHHGVAVQARKIELMIEMMGYLDQRFRMDLMFINNTSAYVKKLKKLAKNDNRIKFIDPVPMLKIAKTINCYDIGLFLLPPLNFNSEVALPNKFFEYIQARLEIAIGPSPEMARFVNFYSLGVVAENFEPIAIAKKLNALSVEDILRFKKGSNAAARELNSEKSSQYLLKEVDNIAKKNFN